MINILSKIFKINGYEYQNLFNDNDIMYFSIKNKEYYTICFVNDLNYITLKRIKKIISKLNTNLLTKEEKSNNTIIICVKVSKSDLKLVEKNIVFDIEEDTINFKKYVLWYTDEEVNNFRKCYYNSIQNSDDISRLACNSYEDFENFKQNMYLETNERTEGKRYTEKQLMKMDEIDRNKAYALLLRLIIKIPFLVLKYLPPLKKDINMFIVNELENVSNGLSEILTLNNIEDKYFDNINLGTKEITEIKNKLLEFRLEDR